MGNPLPRMVRLSICPAAAADCSRPPWEQMDGTMPRGKQQLCGPGDFIVYCFLIRWHYNCHSTTGFILRSNSYAFFFLKNIWHLVMGRAAKWTFSQGWKYRKSYTLGGVLEGKPFPLPFCWLFFFVSLSRSEKNPTPSSERRVTSRPSGQNRDFPTGSLLGSFVVVYGEEAWMGANAGNVQWKRFREESRAVSEMLTQLKTQSKATESSFCPWSCVWVDVNAFLSGVGLGGIRTPHPEFA